MQSLHIQYTHHTYGRHRGVVDDVRFFPDTNPGGGDNTVDDNGNSDEGILKIKDHIGANESKSNDTSGFTAF